MDQVFCIRTQFWRFAAFITEQTWDACWLCKCGCMYASTCVRMYYVVVVM